MPLGKVPYIIACLLLLCGNAAAQTSEEIPFFSRDDAHRAILSALQSLPEVACGKKPCAPATAEEIAEPPINPEQARLALITGAKSARLNWCGLNWKDRAYAALLLRFQGQGIYETRTLALLSLIHDQQFHTDYLGLNALRTCSKDLRASLDKDHPTITLEPWQRVANNALMDYAVADMLDLVLKEIHNSHCGNELCSPATEEEKANPPISITEARQAMRVGLFSGAAKFCDIDWQRSIFFPFLAHHKHALKMTPRQLTLVTMLHGTMQNFVVKQYREHEKTCSDAMRDNLKRELSAG